MATESGMRAELRILSRRGLVPRWVNSFRQFPDSNPASYRCFMWYHNKHARTLLPLSGHAFCGHLSCSLRQWRCGGKAEDYKAPPLNDVNSLFLTLALIAGLRVCCYSFAPSSHGGRAFQPLLTCLCLFYTLLCRSAFHNCCFKVRHLPGWTPVYKSLIFQSSFPTHTRTWAQHSTHIPYLGTAVIGWRRRWPGLIHPVRRF